MKVVKPLRCSLLHRVFDHDGKHFFVATVVALFPFDEPKAILPEVELWKLVGKELGRFGVLDHCMAKLRGELLVTGACFPPGGKPAPWSHVRVTLGPLDKRLYVIGDRTWSLVGPTDPVPFTRMPIDYEHAFGGEKYPQNPVGKGAAPIKNDEGKAVHPLPNVEDPKRIIQSKGDRPPPASLAAWDITWPHHFAKMGTYDQKWLEEQFPGIALDANFDLFNVAPLDQRVEGFFRGDEALTVENMHPTREKIESRLPGLSARCFLRFAPEHEEPFAELPMRLDTVHLFPHEARGLLVFRGARTIHEPDAADIEIAMAALEETGAPRPREHYEAVLAARLDRKKAHLHVLRDIDLVPASVLEAAKALSLDKDELDEAVVTEGLVQKNLRRRMERELEATKEKLRAAGVDPATVPNLALPPPEESAPPNLDELPDFVEAMEAKAEAMQKEGEKRREEAFAKLRELCAEQKVDYDAIVAKSRRESTGAPKFTAEGEIQRLRDLATLGKNAGTPIPGVEEQLADPGLRARLEAAEEQLREAYRVAAHFQEPAPAMDAEENGRAREEIVRRYVAGVPLARRDYTGIDLAGIDLSGADLEDAYFEGANLEGANLRGANLRRAVLARANLTNARLDGAVLVEANLGRTRLSGASLAGADLGRAILYEADLRAASLDGAAMSEALLLDIVIGPDTDLSNIRAEKLFFLKTPLAGVRMRGAKLLLCNFVEVDLTGADFAGAEVKSAAFVECRGDRASFAGANLTNLRLVKNCSFEDADFSDVIASGSNVRGAKLARSSFARADLGKSELGAADLRGSDFTGATLVDARLVRTDLRNARLRGANLLLAVMQRALLAGADFEGANLFAVDLSGSVGDKETSFSGANVERVVAARGAHAKG